MLDALYVLSVIIPLPFWALMIFRPRRAFTDRVLNSYIGPLLLGILYVFTLVGATLTLIGQGALNFSSLAALAVMMREPAAALVFWIHVVALDLIGGYWIYTEAAKIQMPLTSLRVFLFFTLIAGPFGIFCFVMWRLLTRAVREAPVAEAASVSTPMTREGRT